MEALFQELIMEFNQKYLCTLLQEKSKLSEEKLIKRRMSFRQVVSRNLKIEMLNQVQHDSRD